jgi:hypothetical protein
VVEHDPGGAHHQLQQDRTVVVGDQNKARHVLMVPGSVDTAEKLYR